MENKFINNKKIIIILTIIIITAVLVSGCAKNSSSDKTSNKLVIAEQYGLAYAPVQLMKEQKILEKLDSDLQVEWTQLSNTAAIREAMLAGEVDIAFMAIPPFLIAKDKGMDWKIIAGLSESPLALMSNRDYINSINDFKAEDKIALPQPGSIQHILLSMAAERKFSNSQKFDNQLLTMNHPDAMNALLAGKETSAHFASPPYSFLESKETGIKEILSGQEAFGKEFTFIVGVSNKNFHQNNSDKYQLFNQALATALNKFENNQTETVNLLADNYNLETADLAEYLSWPGMNYGLEIKGLKQFINFMYKEGYLTKKNYEPADLIFDFNSKVQDDANLLQIRNNFSAGEVDSDEK